jgi:hypothetical protein
MVAASSLKGQHFWGYTGVNNSAGSGMGTSVQDALATQLTKILSSPQFVRAGRLSAFLRFIVEEAAAGRGDSLKETVIGTAVFGKSPAYDPKSLRSARNTLQN